MAASPAARRSIALLTAIGASLESTGNGVVDATGSERVARLASILRSGRWYIESTRE